MFAYWFSINSAYSVYEYVCVRYSGYGNTTVPFGNIFAVFPKPKNTKKEQLKITYDNKRSFISSDYLF
jgi:hypothetical protein